VSTCDAFAWIISESLFQKLDSEIKNRKVFLITENPYLLFIKLVQLFIPVAEARPGIHALASVDKLALIDPSSEISAFARVDAGAKIGAGVILHSGTWIGADAEVGEKSILYSGVKVHPRCVVGKRNILHAGCVIGSDGFGFTKEKSGENVKVPQVGRAILSDDVEVGANSTIDRGTLDDTYIGEGTKIDNLVQIGHNCRLGKNNLICAMAGLSGHTIVGDSCLLAGNVGTKGHLSIGDYVQVGAQSGVTKDLPSHSDVKGYPARPVKDFLKNQVLLLRLPEIYKRLVSIEKSLSKILSEKGNQG
jgi:UDP-3-O-[3-hydroxymyristoyl] glucosamine N-acyltransferase